MRTSLCSGSWKVAAEQLFQDVGDVPAIWDARSWACGWGPGWLGGLGVLGGWGGRCGFVGLILFMQQLDGSGFFYARVGHA